MGDPRPSQAKQATQHARKPNQTQTQPKQNKPPQNTTKQKNNKRTYKQHNTNREQTNRQARNQNQTKQQNKTKQYRNKKNQQQYAKRDYGTAPFSRTKARCCLFVWSMYYCCFVVYQGLSGSSPGELPPKGSREAPSREAPWRHRGGLFRRLLGGPS